jgi:iron complex outermembrane receptor protein
MPIMRIRPYRPSRLSTCIALLALLWCLFSMPPTVLAGDLGAMLNVNLPAEALEISLRALAKQADLQLSFVPEDVEGVQSSALQGRMTARDALIALLKGSTLTMVEQGVDGVVIAHRVPDATRPLQPGKQTGSSAAVAPAAAESASNDSLDEITVTSRKRTESLVDVPVSVTAMTSQTLTDFKIQSFADYANKIPNLSYGYGAGGTYGVAGSRNIAIRGIVGANTTGFYIDDTPMYDSIDPRIVDTARIEVLRGPQGTLFGSRSLGGNVRIITKQPNVTENEFSYAGQGGYTREGGGDYEGEGIANLVLIPDRLATRAMGFYSSDSGFLTRTYDLTGTAGRASSNNQGATKTVGASLSTLFKATDDLDLTLRVLYQRSATNGWPVAFAPLPAFQVASLTLDREANVQEQSANRFAIPSIELAYRGDHWSVASSTSYSDYKTYDLEDGTEGIQQLYLADFGLALPKDVPIAVGYTNTKQRLTQETRVLFDTPFQLSGVAGVYFDNEHQHLSQPAGNYLAVGQAAAGLWPDDVIYSSDIHNGLKEFAVFGELYQKFLDKFTLTAGARAFSLKETDNQVNGGLFAGTYPVQIFKPPANKEHGVSPKFALQYEPTADSSVYVSAAKGYRPGGVIPSLLPDICASDLAALGKTPNDTSFKSDSIWSYEIGGKQAFDERHLLVTGSLFRINWSNIQQNVYLNCTFITTINVGSARSNGGELELSGHVIDSLELRFGLGYNDAKITSSFPGSPLPAGSRVLQVPKTTASVGARFEQPLTSSVTGFVTGDYSYTGNSISENTTVSFPVARDSYSLLNARIGISWAKSELSLFGNNLTNVKANLGDPTLYTFRQNTTLPNGQTVIDPRVSMARPLQIGLRFQQTF